MDKGADDNRYLISDAFALPDANEGRLCVNLKDGFVKNRIDTRINNYEIT